MKTASLQSLLTLCCCFFAEAIAQEYTPAPNPSECWTSEMVIQEGDLPTETAVIRGGREITTQGTLRALVIFVRFADDTYNHPLYWPDYNVLPSWAQNIVNAQVPKNGIYTPGNISDFFDRASGGDGIGNLGSFRLIGDVYYVTTDSPRGFYGNSVQTVNEHVLTKLDPIVNYALYDNWRFMANGQVYNHEYLPGVGDGKVDYIFMNWRHVSPLDTAGNLGVKNLYANVVKDGKLITFSSGSTQFRYARPNRNIGGPYDQVPGSILVPGHEFTHYIFGGDNITGHIDGRTVYGGIPNIGNVQFFAFMTSNSTAPFSAYERYRAGWLNPEIIETDMSSVLLMDTHVKNKAVMIPVRYDNNTPPNIVEYFLIENFHTRNDYSTANPFLRRQIFNHTLRKGLIVFHIENEDLNLPANSNLDIECADGLWQWNLSVGQATPCDRCDDRIFPDIPSPNLTSGVFDERDVIYLQVGTCLNEYWATNTVGSCLGWYRKDAILGDNEDFFREGETDVFSRWSNPSTVRADLQVTDKAFEIDSYNASTKEYLLKVMVTYNGTIGLKPSKPQALRTSVYIDEYTYRHPRLNWAAMQEPDVINGGNILVYRRTKIQSPTWSSWVLHATLPGDSTGFTDMSISTAGLGTTDSVQYRIQARDSTTKLSVYSDVVSMTVGTDFWKIVNATEGKPETFALAQNFPNPFNPSTTIKYQLAEDGIVALQVFDILGREVTTIAKGFQPAGYYSATFNAENLASGVYFVRFTVNNESGRSIFTKMTKMALVR